MLVNLNGVLKDAYKKQYAIGAFNSYNLETMQATIEAGEEEKTPVIVAFGAKYLPNMSLDTAVAITKSLDRKVTIPVCLHLDHCSDFEVIKDAVKAGFSSVMYDGSMLPLEENIKNTKEIVQYAHSYGVTVEAELGSLGVGEHSHEGQETDVETLTDPEDAKQFVEETNVDALAVSVGTVHGLYKGEPNIHIEVLKKINEKVAMPLVLHGGSGISEKDIIECINNGITKMNVNTEVSMNAVSKLKELLNNEEPHLSRVSISEKEYAKEIIKKYISFLGN